jgi:hypothetical protein
LPAWRFVDPLPVLGSLADDMEYDEESLESIVESKGNNVVDTQVVAAPSFGIRLVNVFGWKRQGLETPDLSGLLRLHISIHFR